MDDVKISQIMIIITIITGINYLTATSSQIIYPITSGGASSLRSTVHISPALHDTPAYKRLNLCTAMLKQHLIAHLITQFWAFCRNSVTCLRLVLFKVLYKCLIFSTFAKLNMLAPFVRVGNTSLPGGLCCVRHRAFTVKSYFVFRKTRRKKQLAWTLYL